MTCGVVQQMRAVSYLFVNNVQIAIGPAQPFQFQC